MPPIDKLLSQYSAPVRSWPGEEDLDAEARANYAAANPPKLQTEGGSIDKGDLLPIVRYPVEKKSPSEWQSSSDVMRQLDDGWRIEPFSRLMAPFKSMAEAWRNQPVLGPMVRPSQMHPEVFNQMSGDAMTVAGTGMTGGIGRAAVGAKLQPGTTELGIFGGRKAGTADLEALARAEEMARVGTPRETIWSETGWFQGPDKAWRFEIDDSGDLVTGKGALYRPGKLRSEILEQGATKEGIERDGYQGILANVLDHEGAYNAYPTLAHVPWQSVPGEKMALPHMGGVWKGDRFGMEINADLSPRLETGKSITLHELQHAIQGREGFGQGANVKMFEMSPEQIQGTQRQLAEVTEAQFVRQTADKYGITPREAAVKIEQDIGRSPLPEAVDYAERFAPEILADREARLRQKITASIDPQNAYRRTAGEAEARLVQKRMNMSDAERRARPPWLDYDVPEKDQIVRFGNESGAMSNKPAGMKLYRGNSEGNDPEANRWFTTDPRHAREFGEVSEYSADFRNPFALDWNDPVHGDLFRGGGRSADDNLYALANEQFARGHDAVVITNHPEGSGTVVLSRDALSPVSSSPTLMASIDPLTAAVSPARQVDPLGYYSPTLDAALRLSQKKGTPEQMLAQLKKAGAKDSEIEVSGLKKMFEGKRSVSQEEIVKALEEGKIGLEEKIYGSPDANAADAAARATEQALREAFEAAGASPMEARMLLADASMGDVPPQYMTRETIPLVEAFQRVADETESRDLAGGPRWSAHSLDPENPTYREVVLHLPEASAAGQMKAAYEAAQKRYADAVAKQETIDRRKPQLLPEEQAIIDEVQAARAELQKMSQPVADLNFQSGHFDEPNIVGHMMVSETRLPLDVGYPAGVLDEIGQRIMLSVGAKNVKDLGSGAMDTAVKRGAVTPDEASAWSFHHFGNRLGRDPRPRVLTLDQVQSDWGQKLRDGGVRDEGKIAELKERLAQLPEVPALAVDARRFMNERGYAFGLEEPKKDAFGRMTDKYWSDDGVVLRQLERTIASGGSTRGKFTPEEVARAQQLLDEMKRNNEVANTRKLLKAELATAQAATPGHPLVNTTDQWLNTTLRRAIRMASEEGQDYIAIPSGNTVLGYNPGQERGMLGFYGGMPEEMSGVMASLKQAATKAPNEPVINVLDPKTIDALAQAGILDKKKIEGISAARVLKNAEARFQGIVPKNLYALLQKLDKATPPPQVIDTLDSPSGKTGLGEGFTLFKITPEAKKAAKESGQPLFRFGGRVN